ncbi:DUF2935 domain-containing protein [Anaeroselena agilis]|uniref:DUF2935 domain-containing protein n=1 Tax=Anaeroselena agilis TaxID=3063788 RepID=A0ABU3P149_9FIRM|nr:DUF2935 domain-containing protein [Selenomonadales bacterium 4137-cl]
MEIICREVRPYPPLDMHQVRFWLRIMKEHALFIRLGLPCDQTELRKESQCFYDLFEKLEQKACHVNCGEAFRAFVEEVMVAVKNLFAFKRHLLCLLIECKIRGGANYPLLIDHISREALYFYKLLQKICDGEMEYPADAIVSENVFWIRIMADHLKFIRGLLDPSEREVFEQTQALSDKWDGLNLHARDFESMLWHMRPNNDFARFEKTVTDAAVELRGFKATAQELIERCSVLSLIPPLLADHVRREAEQFLRILEMIGGELGECQGSPIIRCDDDCMDLPRR